MSKIVSKEEILDRLNSIKDFKNEYEINENSIIGSSKKAEFKHKKCGHVFNMIIKDFTRGQRCPLCAKQLRIIHNTKKEKTNDQKQDNAKRKFQKVDFYIEKCSENQDYTFNKLVEAYHGCHTKALFTHNSCGKKFIKRFSDFLYNKQGCPYCVSTGRKNEDTIIIEKFKNAGFELLENPKRTHDKVKLRCLSCGEIQERSFNTIINLNGKCSCQRQQYAGEEMIKRYLNENKINYIPSKTFDDLKLVSQLRIDVFATDFNIAIEYDGRQHFIPNNFFYHDSFETLHERDLAKNKYCLENNIQIIRISYKVKSYSSIKKILDTVFNIKNDGKPYDGKLSRTVWVGGKSNYDDYFKYNSNN